MPDQEKKNVITNTTRAAEENPGRMIAEALVFGPSNAIEVSERRGQLEFLESDVLPADMKFPSQQECRELLTQWGFVLGEAVEGDDLFIHAKLPAGWKREGSDHAMWSHILDDKGRKRIGIFYKAAFYDRCATLGLLRRFVITTDGRSDHNNVYFMRFVVKDCDQTVFEGEWVENPFKNRESMNAAEDKAKAWLKERYPDWTNFGAYW